MDASNKSILCMSRNRFVQNYVRRCAVMTVAYDEAFAKINSHKSVHVMTDQSFFCMVSSHTSLQLR